MTSVVDGDALSLDRVQHWPNPHASGATMSDTEPCRAVGRGKPLPIEPPVPEAVTAHL